jgi:hypothetical protein
MTGHDLLGLTLNYRAAPRPCFVVNRGARSADLIEEAQAARRPEQPITEVIGNALRTYYAKALVEPLPTHLSILADSLEASVRGISRRDRHTNSVSGSAGRAARVQSPASRQPIREPPQPASLAAKGAPDRQRLTPY